MKFQNILLGILLLAVVAAIFIFANGTGTSGSSNAKAIQLNFWGTLSDRGGLKNALNAFNKTYNETYRITYTQIPEDSFAETLIESIADGKAPDIILVSEKNLIRIENKLVQFSFSSIPVSTFESQYLDISKVFMTSKGYLALPALIDPVVSYWNKDMFTNISELESPKYWDQIIPLQSKLTKKSEQAASFDQSIIALGEFSNITHAKEILSTLFLQVGVPVVQRTQNDTYTANLSPAVRVTGEPPADSTLRFYVDFSNPMKTLYSWNRSLPDSRDTFISEKLAIYLGKVSDYSVIKEKNPHLNFGISQVPQVRDTKSETTFATIYGLAAVKSSPRSAAALKAIATLVADKNFISTWSNESNLPPARKDLLLKAPTDSARPIFYNAALRSKTWPDPDGDKSSFAMKEAIEGLLSGRFAVPAAAVSFLSKELDSIIK